MSTVPPSDTSSGSQSVERSLNGQVVLEEDEYTAALSQIIARDFFPSLVHLDATNGYLDALSSRDPHLINASVRRLEEISSTPQRPYQTPSRTPYGTGPSDTPLRTPRGEAPSKRARIDTDMNLDLFQARYTSEDNSSFTQIMDDENRKRKERWAWAWDAQKRVEAQRDRMVEGRERMLIEAPPVTGVREKFAIELPTPAGLITDGKEAEGQEQEEGANGKEKGKSKEVILKNEEEGDTPVDVMAPVKDTRSAGVDGWKFKTRNSLMFPPDADESPYHPPVNTTEAGSVPKVVKYANTRLPEQEESSGLRASSAPPSPTRSRIDAAITGTPYRPRSPTINTFSLVPTLPSPTPSELGPTAVKQLMTWGTLNATPRIISQSDDVGLPPPSTPFHLPDITSREALSHRLSSKASKSLREKAGLMGLSGITNRTPRTTRTPGGSRGKGGMGPPSWTPRRSEAAGNLTPAARRLLERSTLGSAALKRAEVMERKAGWDDGRGKDKDLNRVRWTPTPGT
ncbi:nuclear protein DGCR14 [Infundibulicybe gibba]|nr:nuclear protein DGCR14 [Infundibulicybe gibba]